jgi:hypothetical protein
MFFFDRKACRKKRRRLAKKAIMCALKVRDAFQSQISALLTSDGINPPHGIYYLWYEEEFGRKHEVSTRRTLHPRSQTTRIPGCPHERSNLVDRDPLVNGEMFECEIGRLCVAHPPCARENQSENDPDESTLPHCTRRSGDTPWRRSR